MDETSVSRSGRERNLMSLSTHSSQQLVKRADLFREEALQQLNISDQPDQPLTLARLHLWLALLSALLALAVAAWWVVTAVQ